MKKWVVLSAVAVFAAATSIAGPLNTADVSAGAKWLVHLDAQKLLASRIGKLSTDESTNEELKKGLDVMRATLHFDPLKDVNSVTLYGDDYRHESGVAVVRGGVNTEAIQTLEKLIVASKSHEQVTYGTRIIHKWIDEKKNKPSALCFYAAGVTVLGGNVEKVQEAIDVLDGKKAALGAGAVLKIPANTGFLVVSARKPEGKTGGGDQARAAVIQNADWATIVVGDTGDNVSLEINLGANSVEAAQKMEQVVRGIIAFMSLAPDQDPAVLDIARAVSVGIDNTVVGIKLSYSADALYNCMKKHEKRQHQKGPAGEKPESGTNAAPGGQIFKF